ncbi:hypothetical protein BT96DRAFT_1018915 [Gymnopus androsaceus JB14]|uniref:Uncharacterized protein n=1 Tax=Gymnopus androsaceus JB14 TaxID=1447944 RepID=A0A6A4HTV8_9AGAR|nr:hypothetical protein BT96DRAFT_1018915 [Gymnopus androsaceus JB14]
MSLWPTRLDDCRSMVLVLASYPAMVKRLFGRYQREATNRSGVLITGQPGIGKSVFLWYLLAVLLTLKDDSPVRRAPVLLYHDVHIILFYDDRAYTPISPSTFDFTALPEVDTSNAIWALIDVDDTTGEPAGLAGARGVFPIQAASPDPKRYRNWLRKRKAVMWGFPFWTVEELLAGWKVQKQYAETIADIDYWLNHRDDPVKPEFELHLIHRTTLEDALFSGQNFIHNEQEDKIFEDEQGDETVEEEQRDETVEDEDEDMHMAEYPGNDTQEQAQKATEETKEQQQPVSSINPEEAAKILLSHAITKYGWAARDVYEYLHSPAAVVDSHEYALKLRAEAVWEDTFKFVQHFVVTRDAFAGDVPHSHRIIAIKLSSEVVGTSLKENDKWFPIIKSDYITGEMDQKLLQLTEEKCQNYYATFKEMGSDGASVAGCVYETIVHDKICKGIPLLSLQPMFPVKKNTARTSFTITSTSPVPLNRLAFPSSTRFPLRYGNLLEVFTLDKYYIPLSHSNPLFDAFFFSKGQNESFVVLTISQVSTEMNHGGSPKALSLVEIIKKTAECSFGMPVHVRYLLICPEFLPDHRGWEFPLKGYKVAIRGPMFYLGLPVPYEDPFNAEEKLNKKAQQNPLVEDPPVQQARRILCKRQKVTPGD